MKLNSCLIFYKINFDVKGIKKLILFIADFKGVFLFFVITIDKHGSETSF